MCIRQRDDRCAGSGGGRSGSGDGGGGSGGGAEVRRGCCQIHR